MLFENGYEKIYLMLISNVEMSTFDISNRK